MKSVEVYLNGRSCTSEDLKGKSVLVIDVLRACSTIITSFENGARAVIPVADMAEAGKIAAHMGTDTIVMGGERGGLKIDGYQLGNSPLDYTREVVEDRTVVLNTSNGTGAVTRARGAHAVAVGCFLNVSAAIDFVRDAETDVAIICAGNDKRVALEDILCAGMILHAVWEGNEPNGRSDASHIAFGQFARDKDNVVAAIARSNHGTNLVEMGFEQDVAYCSQIDTSPLLPIYRDSRLVLSPTGTASTVEG